MERAPGKGLAKIAEHMSRSRRIQGGDPQEGCYGVVLRP